ncbi:hypothetical protein ACFL02_08175, partial [Planctomycetota bacterium]
MNSSYFPLSVIRVIRNTADAGIPGYVRDFSLSASLDKIVERLAADMAGFIEFISIFRIKQPNQMWYGGKKLVGALVWLILLAPHLPELKQFSLRSVSVPYVAISASSGYFLP